MPRRSCSLRFSSARIVFSCAVLLFSLIASPLAMFQRPLKLAGPPRSVQVLLSNNLAAPDGTITVTPVARDEAGVIIDDPNLRFLIGINANGLVAGNAPLIEGRTIRFPKVVKQLINPRPDIDPEGEYADADPADPNYGQETGGFYRVTATLVGTSLSGSADVTVLPSGTAKITVQTKQYADEMVSALGAMTAALNLGDRQAIEEARSHLQSIADNTDYSYDVLSENDVLAPANGYPVTPAQLIAAGFGPGKDDERFAPLIDEIISLLAHARILIDQLNPAYLTLGNVAELRSILESYKILSQKFAGLEVSPLGVIEQSEKLNGLMVSEIPRMLDSIKLKALALAATISLAAQAGRTKTGRTKKDGPIVDLVPVVFSAVTNFSGFATANILEGSITAANSLLNIYLAHVINSHSSGSLVIEYLGASASQAYVCPNYRDTFIGGSGLTSNRFKIKVLLVGCVNSQALANLLLLRPGAVKDIAAGLKLIKAIFSNARALSGEFVKVVHPADYVRTDYIWDYTVYYTNGWPRVNQGRLPCVGTVVVFNMEAATFAAVNSNFLPHCG